MATNNNIPTLHRKEWQMMTPAPVTTAAGMFVIADPRSVANEAMYVASATAQYLYHHDEDSFAQIPSGALAGTFGAGACGTRQPWSITYTANGGSTTTITVAAATHNLNGFVKNKVVEFLSGTAANVGLRRKIIQIKTVDAGTGTITLTLDRAVPSAVASSDTFRIASGRFYVMSAGTTAAGSWKVFDVGTLAWQSNLSTTSLPATWATDGKAVSTANFYNYDDAGTATSGSTTSLADSSKNWTTNGYAGYWLLCIDGTGEGQFVQITSNTATTLSFSAVTTGFDATSVYEIRGQRPFAVGVATAGTSTTLTNSAKSWTTNQWTNYQVKILSGTGIGQIRTIASNTGTVLTVSSAWTTTPDTTSVYLIQGNEDYIYLAGNNAVTMYRYSISGNSWTVMAPTVARSAAPSTGMSMDWVDNTEQDSWYNESDFREGRYIYSVRGGAGALIDRFDIAGGTAGAGAWVQVTYVATETFTTGSSAFADGRYIYIRKDATHRFFKYSITGNYMEPLSVNMYTDGAALLGQKIWVFALDRNKTVRWVYSLQNTGTALHRLMII